MNWRVVYYSEKVKSAVMSLPVGIAADYLRLTEAMMAFGANLRMPHSRAMGDGLFELRPKGAEKESDACFTVRRWASKLWYCTRS